MLLVIASRHDQVASALIDQWSRHEADLLTCEDLSLVGWHH